MSTIRVVNIQHSDATEPNIVLNADGTATFVSGITISGGTNLTVSGTAEFASGTVSAPGITFIDDNNTGIYSPGADQLAISTNGTQALYIDSDGDILVADGNRMEIDEVRARDGDGLKLFDDAGAGIFVQDGGNVGIGTSSPSYLLDCKSTGTTNVARFLTGSTSSSEVAQFGRSDQAVNLSIDYDGAGSMGIGTTTAHPFNLKTGAVTRATIDSSGNVGIGTTSPAITGLTIENASVSQGLELEASSGFAAGPTVRGYYRSGSAYKPLGLTGSSVIFGIQDVEKARIDSSGRLLVGTSSAYSEYIGSSSGYEGLLSIARNEWEGTVQFSNWTSNANLDSHGGTAIFISRCKSGTVGTHTGGALSSGNPIGRIVFNTSDGTNFRSSAYITAEVDGAVSTADVPGRLVFSTTADGASSPTERMRIKNNGQVYINGTSNISGTSDNTTLHVTATGPDYVTAFANSSATPYGLYINYSTAANNTSSNFLYCSDPTLRASIRSNGGLANYSANNINLSDRNVKKNIAPAAGTWDCLKEWEIVNFRYKDQPDDADLNMGVIAQQVAESCPEVVIVFEEAKDDQPEKLGVKDQQMTWMAIKTLQEAQLRIEELEAKVAALEAQ